MSAVDELRSVFATNKSALPKRTSLKPNDPSPPLISAEQQWLTTVSSPPPSRSGIQDKESSGVITLQPFTPSQEAAQKRLRGMQEEIREVIGIMRMNLNKCIEPDRRLSELYNLGPDYNQKWKCGQSLDKAPSKNKKLRRICCLLGIILIIALAFLGDYWVSRWVIQHEIHSELAESILAKQQIESSKNLRTMKVADAKVVTATQTVGTTPLSTEVTKSVSVTSKYEENKELSKSEQVDASALANEKSVISDVDKGEPAEHVVVEPEIQGQKETTQKFTEPEESEVTQQEPIVEENNVKEDGGGEETPTVPQQDPFASLQDADIGPEFPRGHDVLDLALVDTATLPNSHAAFIPEGLCRPTDESDIQQEELMN